MISGAVTDAGGYPSQGNVARAAVTKEVMLVLIRTGAEWQEPQALLPFTSEHFPLVVHEADSDFDAVTTQFYQSRARRRIWLLGKVDGQAAEVHCGPRRLLPASCHPPLLMMTALALMTATADIGGGV